MIIHGWLIVTLSVSVASGLRFASDLTVSSFLRSIAPALPVTALWKLHLFAGTSLVALAIAYPAYLASTGLTRRVSLDLPRLAAFVNGGPARWSALNVLLYWILFVCLAIQLITGVALFKGYGGWVVDIHLAVTWIVLAYAVAHVATHFAFGGVRQLLRVVRPAPIPVAAVFSTATPSRKPAAGPGALALGLSIVAGLVIALLALRYDRAARDVLQVVRIPASEMRDLQPNLSDVVWRAPALVVQTNQGMNFDGTGATAVEIRAVHDDEFLGLAISWSDSTRSLKHAPLIKRADGWHGFFTPPEDQRPVIYENVKLASEEPSGFEDTLAEDKFSVMVTDVERPFGPGAFHPGAKPLGDRPPSSSGRGLHYADDGFAPNIWLWHANGDASGRCDNARIGPPAAPVSDQIRGLAPYKGGIVAASATSAVVENFAPTLPRDPDVAVTPLRLPSGASQLRADVDLNPDDGDPADARWRLTGRDSIPYSAEADARIPVGTIIPGLVSPDPGPPNSGDVYCSAKWAAGRWMLLIKRRLNTGREGDIPISSGTYMWVAAFDHTVANHTRHIRPFRLEMRR